MLGEKRCFAVFSKMFKKLYFRIFKVGWGVGVYMPVEVNIWVQGKATRLMIKN